MRYIADLHIHSRFSRACSKHLFLHTIAYWCKVKGVDVVSCADFTHPQWYKEIENSLEEAEPGLYKIKTNYLIEQGFSSQKKGQKKRFEMDTKVYLAGTDYFLEELQQIRFFISTEISCIFSQGGKVRRLHLMIFAPSLKVAKKINKKLEQTGAKLTSDGRPILGLSAKRVLEIILEIDSRCVMIPAHAWTPWFAIFGSKSGFNSLQECFEDLTSYIFSIETGLSSDPPMNWRVSELDNITLVSNSDAHSPQNIAREANVFDFENFSYDAICQTIKSGDKKNFLYTIEFYPEEGMYHFDGHRSCNVSFSPEETKKIHGICPQCKKPLTVGVMSRVDELSDQEGILGERVPYKSLVGLDDIIAEAIDSRGRRTKKVMQYYEKLIKKFENELNVLLFTDIKEISRETIPEITEGIRRNRLGQVHITPGYDGVYGKVKLFSQKEKESFKQASLF